MGFRQDVWERLPANVMSLALKRRLKATCSINRKLVPWLSNKDTVSF
jgi:hypothetical protein